MNANGRKKTRVAVPAEADQRSKVTEARMKDSEVPSKPVYITSLSVENIKCFGPKQTLDLTDEEGKPHRWTVLLGDNGVGKTTILKAIFATRPIEEIRLLEEQRRYSLSTLGLFELFRHVEREERAQRIDNKGYITLSLSRAHLYECIDKNTPPIDFKLSIADNSAGSHHYDGDLNGLRIFCYSASRRMGSSSFIERMDWNDPKQQQFDQEQINAEEWLLRADYIASKYAKKRNLNSKRDFAYYKNVIQDVLIDLLPDVTDIRFAPPGNSKNANLRVQFCTDYGWVFIDDLSLGYKTMVGWIVDLAARMFDLYPNSSDPLREPAIVLVDEIDLHMHPSWQRKIIGYLTERFPNVQFIVTAHSPLIVQSAEDANIVVLRRVGDHVEIDNNPVNVKYWRIDQIVSSDLFENVPVRSPESEDVLHERRSLLKKTKLTKKEQIRLNELNKIVDSFPTAGNQEDIEAMELIRSVAKKIKEKEGVS